MEERCIMCGEIIPEGRQVCPACEKKVLEDNVISVTDTEYGDTYTGFFRKELKNYEFTLRIYPDKITVVRNEFPYGRKICREVYSFYKKDIRYVTQPKRKRVAFICNRGNVKRWIYKKDGSLEPYLDIDEEDLHIVLDTQSTKLYETLKKYTDLITEKEDT